MGKRTEAELRRARQCPHRLALYLHRQTIKRVRQRLREFAREVARAFFRAALAPEAQHDQG